MAHARRKWLLPAPGSRKADMNFRETLLMLCAIAATLWKRRFKVSCVALCFLVGSSNQKIFAQNPFHSFHTTVAPFAGEDIARPCEYEMGAPSSGKKIRAVFVVFERGPGSLRFYNDPDVLSFADKHQLAMMMPRNCSSKVHEDMDIDPSNGLGRALFTALDQFSTQTSRPELRTAPVILLGFSGAGAFAGRLVGFAPQRIAAAVLSHAGQFPQLNLNTISTYRREPHGSRTRHCGR
jgi:hypothetical protein